MTHRLLNPSLLGLVFLLSSTSAFALPSDRYEPINIEADHAQLDDERGVTQYKGRAILTQGTLRIEGDIITFFYDENRAIKKAVAEGNLATYRQVHKEGEPPVRARAVQMEYWAAEQKIYLIGQGYVWQDGDEFSGNHIEYDIARNIVNAHSRPVQAGGQEQASGRVHLILRPATAPKTESAPAPTPAPAPSPAEVAPATPPPAPVTDASAEYPSAVTASRLNVRTGPGTQYSRIGTFETNTTVLVLTRQGQWHQVRGQIGNEVVIGWVDSRYLIANPGN